MPSPACDQIGILFVLFHTVKDHSILRIKVFTGICLAFSTGIDLHEHVRACREDILSPVHRMIMAAQIKNIADDIRLIIFR